MRPQQDTTLTVRLNREQKARVNKLAARFNRSTSNMTRLLIECGYDFVIGTDDGWHTAEMAHRTKRYTNPTETTP
jgi:predicted transcriptional regulator